MDNQQTRILDDLRDVVTGDILVDDLSRAAYSTDASILQVRPLAVVAPRTFDELVSVVKYAAETGLSIHPRGAGTGLAGESLGNGLMVDTSRYLNRILQTGKNTVRVEPGVQWSDLQSHLATIGRMFGPDPVSGDRCTIGGMLATDAAGPHSLRYGTTRDHVLRLRVVLADGEILEIGREKIAPGKSNNDAVHRIVSEVGSILQESAEDIEREQPAGLLKRGGYSLRGALSRDSVDLARLLVGSEGTLAIFAEAVLATSPTPPHRGLLLACFRTLESAANAVLESLEYQPTACELLDRRLLSLVRDVHPLYRQWIPEDSEGLLLIEQEGSSPDNTRYRLGLMAQRLRRMKRPASEIVEITQEPELSLCWAIRNRSSAQLAQCSGNVRPIAFVENAAVPPEKLPRFLKRVQNVMKRHGVTASYSAHAGVGILHTRPLLDIHRSDHVSKLEAIAAEVQEAALECGGANNGEHGVGLLRSGLLPRQYPKLYGAFCKIKAVFDPQNRLNPGKIVGAEPGFPIQHLRVTGVMREEAPPPQLLWPTLSLIETAERCNGCGSCRTTNPAARMCPTFKVMGTELASPRAKANLMRQIVRGELDPKTLSSDEFREVADLCVNCKMCKVECPSSVDISKLMLDAKAANTSEHGLSRSDWFFSRLEGWSRWASANALFANALLGNRQFRWLTEKFFGLSRYRQIPRFHHKTFLRRATQHGWTQKPRSSEPRPKVAFLADNFVNYNDPYLGELAVRVLDRQQVKVFVPPNQRASGMAPLQYGDVEGARSLVEWNLNIFAELAREGYDIVTTEPSAALMFREDARGLIADPDLDLIASHTYEFSEYLGMLAAKGKLDEQMQPVPLTVAYHEPCHQRALNPRGSAASVMQMIPRLRLVSMDLGCSGMAGTYGMSADNYETSRLAGSLMIDRLARDDIDLGMTQCSACRMQMEQGSGKRTLHPAKWLAIAYGLARRPERLIQAPGKGLVTP